MAKPGWETDFKVPGSPQVRLTLFWGDNYRGALYKDQIAKMREMLAQHGMRLDLLPANGEPTDQFKVKVPVKERELLYPDDYNELRNRCAAKFDDQAVEPRKQRLPVIFCEFVYAAHGLTVDGGPWPAWCMVGAIGDPYTLIHETGHAAKLPHLETTHQNQDDSENFMFDGAAPDRSLMHKLQVQKYVQAYFVV